MDKIIEKLNQEQRNSKHPAFRPGDTVRVHQIIQEGGKERIQIFEGVVILRNRSAETFTVRKISYNIGVERIFPVCSPLVSKIEVKHHGRVRRSRLYYLRDLRGKAARIREDRIATNLVVDSDPEVPIEPAVS